MKMLIAPKIQTYYLSNYKVILYTFNAEMNLKNCINKELHLSINWECNEMSYTITVPKLAFMNFSAHFKY